ncbi:glutaryl-7-ACA acylase [Sphingomonas sp. Root710]|uniref:CocE/NonD family hydrolase n=1 Tax=Sphingomonas sp. Root710 TaxID=1736594 RepID=UPI0006F31D57|nr:CocE/NonD family hydrolase [Sphingomonas sp. Root710]KRB82637.1 glutaryl-7-ACA acylase [Sphingomonas sp. Root710]
MISRRFLAAAALAALATTAFAQTMTAPMTPDIPAAFDATRPEADYIRREVMIPMRDGKKMFAVIVMRKGTQDAPILLTRTPYNAGKATSRNPSQKIEEILPVSDAEFVNDGYIRVYEDVRGRNRSEGDYVMVRPLRGPLNDTPVDHATDAYDTIDWLVKNVPESNGRVAVTGSSYGGFTTLMATVDPHPALKAVVPMSPMADGWIGDDWFHNGAFRQASYDYLTGQMASKDDGGPVSSGTGDQYALWLKAGSAGDYVKAYGLDAFPVARKLQEHPAYDDYWKGQAVDKALAARPFTVPMMLVVGQWDQEDSYGAPAVYRALKPKDPDGRLHLVIGPWRHSGVNYDGTTLGPLRFTGDTALQFRRDVMKPFLDQYVKTNAPRAVTPPVLTYDSGAKRWQPTAAIFDTKLTPLYLQTGASLGWDKAAKGGHDDYVSDPAKPVPFVARPVHWDQADVWKPWLVSDQRHADGRPDVLTYVTPPLTKAVHILGQPMVDLHAATSGTDSDWVVKLIDVYPEELTSDPKLAGYQLGIGMEIFRGRYVDGFDKPRPLKPGKVENYRFLLPAVNHSFMPGHRIMVQIQSSWFPLYDRNPQSYVKNIFFAKPGDYRKATQSIFTGGAAASAVLLPIVD